MSLLTTCILHCLPTLSFSHLTGIFKEDRPMLGKNLVRLSRRSRSTSDIATRLYSPRYVRCWWGEYQTGLSYFGSKSSSDLGLELCWSSTVACVRRLCNFSSGENPRQDRWCCQGKFVEFQVLWLRLTLAVRSTRAKFYKCLEPERFSSWNT